MESVTSARVDRRRRRSALAGPAPRADTAAITTPEPTTAQEEQPFETDGGAGRRLPVALVLALVAAVVVVARLTGPGVGGELAVGPSDPPATVAATPEVAQVLPALAQGIWSPMPAAAIPARTRHTATWTGAELLVYGGQPDPGTATGARFAVDVGGVGAWRPMSTSPLGSRVGHTATWTGTELVVLEGAPVGQPAAVAAQSLDGAAYDPATDTWRPIDGMPINPRTGHVAAWTGGEVFVYGGSRTFETYAPAALYDPVADTWRLTSPSPLARAYGQAAAVWTGEEVVVWTGQGEEDVAAYDPATDTWRLLPGSPVTLQSVTALWTGEEVLLLGRSRDVGGAALDLAEGRWTTLPPSPQSFAVTVSVAWTGESAVVVGGPPEAPGWVWTPDLGRWDPLPPATQPAISGHSATWTGESLLVWGGQGGSRPLGSGVSLHPPG